MKQTASQLVALQTAMWRLKAEMRVDEQAKQDMRDLAWEELHVRYQLRSLQIRIEISEKVRWNVDNVMPNRLCWKKWKIKTRMNQPHLGWIVERLKNKECSNKEAKIQNQECSKSLRRALPPGYGGWVGSCVNQSSIPCPVWRVQPMVHPVWKLILQTFKMAALGPV